MANNMAVVNWIEPPHNVAVQLNILMPVGSAISIVVAAKKMSGHIPKPTANM